MNDRHLLLVILLLGFCVTSVSGSIIGVWLIEHYDLMAWTFLLCVFNSFMVGSVVVYLLIRDRFEMVED